MLSYLTEQIDSRPLGLARSIVGVAALVKAAITGPILLTLTGERVVMLPHFSWFPEPSTPLTVASIGLWVLAAVAFTIGWRVAISGTVLTLVIGFSLALDQQVYSNHLYLLGWLVLLMTVADAGAGLNVQRTNRPVVRWPVLLLMAQLSIVYGFSALTKINPGFMGGEVLAAELSGGLIPFPESLVTPPAMVALAGVVIVVEAALALLIWSARFRPLAFLLGLGLHLSITLFMSPTGQLAVFSLEMLALYPLFLTGHPLVVSRQSGCLRCSDMETRFRRYDLLGALAISETSQEPHLRLAHDGRTTTGANAHTRVVEHLVPWMWVAPVLRLPVARQIHERWWRRAHAGPEPRSG